MIQYLLWEEALLRNQTSVIRTGNKLQVVRGTQLPRRAGVGEGHWEGASVISVWIVTGLLSAAVSTLHSKGA